MVVKEYPSEDRVEYILPHCPRCGKITRHVEYPSGTETVISLMSRCYKCGVLYRPDDEDVITIQKYPLNKIFVVS